MKYRAKRLTSLGLGAVLTGGLLTACEPAEDAAEPSEEQTAAFQPDDATQTQASDPAAAVQAGEANEGGEGEGGEGGEGEGGVAIASASEDPVVFNSALAITAAHVIAARDAHAAGRVDEAAGMFAHPVSEVLADIRPVFEERGVQSFDDMLIDASSAVLDGADAAQIAERSEAILAALDEAAARAPQDGSSDAAIAAGVAADQIERASDMYRMASRSSAYEPYLDGYGFYKAAERAFAPQAEAIEAENPEGAARIREALELLAQAYPEPVRPEGLDIEQAELNARSTQAHLAVRF